MPEGPEVKVMTDQIREISQHYPYLLEFKVIGGRYQRHPFPNVESFQAQLPMKIKFLEFHKL